MSFHRSEPELAYEKGTYSGKASSNYSKETTYYFTCRDNSQDVQCKAIKRLPDGTVKAGFRNQMLSCDKGQRANARGNAFYVDV